MRRRQIYAERAGETPPVAVFNPAPVALPRGCCRKCGKYIGRGVRFHEKACRG